MKGVINGVRDYSNKLTIFQFSNFPVFTHPAGTVLRTVLRDSSSSLPSLAFSNLRFPGSNIPVPQQKKEAPGMRASVINQIIIMAF